MKVKINKPDLLIAGETPWFIAIMLLFFILIFAAIGLLTLSQTWAGLIFLFVGCGLGLGAMGVFVERLQLILDARANTLTMRSRTLFRYNQTVIPLDEVIRAETESSLSNNRDGPTSRRTVSRIAFVVRDGSGTGGTVVQPLTSVMSSGKGTGTVTRAVNDWLKSLRGTDTLADTINPARA